MFRIYDTSINAWIAIHNGQFDSNHHYTDSSYCAMLFSCKADAVAFIKDNGLKDSVVELKNI
jgi:hypothetical protein